LSGAANASHLEKIKEGVGPWNLWRFENPGVEPALCQADLRGMDLAGADLTHADLYNARLCHANLAEARLGKADLALADLTRANLAGAELTDVNLDHANLHGADLRGADLDWADLFDANLFGLQGQGADFHAANFIRADLTNANLAGANLTEARLVETVLKGADLSGCHVYGASVWKADLEGATQTDLVVTPEDEPEVTVDDLEVAQLVYLLLDNEKVRNFIDSLTSKAVLILGSFSPPARKAVLDAVKRELRERGYAPILFDFEGPESQDATTTVTTLVRLSRFVVADLTDQRSSPHELASFAPEVPVPIRPLVLQGYREYGMFGDQVWRYDWVLEPYRYEGLEHLLATFDEEVVAPAEAKARELRIRLRS
jgi:uncharacterized protein YjbI with pentapeptide repeats